MQPFPHFHWFVIDGKRPNIPENFIREEHKSVQVEYQPTKELLGPDLTAQSVEKQVTSNGNVKQQGNKIIAPVIHNISKELQIFLENFEQRFRKEIKFIHLNPSSNLMLSNEILISLNVIETEPGVVELLPYIIEFLMSNLANQQYIKEPKVHMIILHYIDAILKNPYFYLEPYLHQLVTLILSLILMENSNQFLDQIIRVKDFAIETLSRIHRKYETKYPNFSQQIIRICKDNIVPNINNPCYLTTYGAIKSINAFGPLSIIDHIIPKLDQIIQRFNTIYVLSKHKETYNEDKSQLNLPLTQSQPESFPKISFSMPVGYTINPPITSSILLDASSFDANKKETSQNKVDVKLSDFKNIVTNINEKACYVYNALKVKYFSLTFRSPHELSYTT